MRRAYFSSVVSDGKPAGKRDLGYIAQMGY
jgi:hypothetical protein